MNVSAISPTTWRQIHACWQALEDKKAEQLRLLYVGPRSSVTDFFLIATGTSEPHLKALSTTLAQTLKAENVALVGRDQERGSGWMVVDAFDFVIHVFLPEVRARYALEQLWKDAVEIDAETLRAAALPPAREQPAAKKAAAPRKKAVKKAAAAARKTTAKKATKKATEKAPAKKATAKKAATKAAAKKAATKTTARKTSSKTVAKTAVKKTAAKKAAAKKP